MLAGAPVFTGLKPAQIRAESALPEQHRNWALFKLTSLRKRAQTQGQAMAYSASMEKCTVEKWMENRLNTNPMGFGSCAGYWEPRGDGQHSAKGWLIISTKSFPVVFIFHIKQESRQAKKKGWKSAPTSWAKAQEMHQKMTRAEESYSILQIEESSHRYISSKNRVNFFSKELFSPLCTVARYYSLLT